MKVVADTNVLLRTIVDDDEAQCARAVALLESVDRVAVSVQSLCELVWVPKGRYNMQRVRCGAAGAR